MRLSAHFVTSTSHQSSAADAAAAVADSDAADVVTAGAQLASFSSSLLLLSTRGYREGLRMSADRMADSTQKL